MQSFQQWFLEIKWFKYKNNMTNSCIAIIRVPILLTGA
jgi:hypothetical protein